MPIKIKTTFSLLVGILLLNTTDVYAYEEGDAIFRLGPAMVDPKDDSTVLSLNGLGIAGTGVTVDDNTQLGLTLTLMLTDHMGFEILAATPFSHTITAQGLGGDLETAEVKHLPPTISYQYFPASSRSSFQPYVGLGVNYTKFFSEELTSDFENVFGPGDIELRSSSGLALQLGFDYQLSEKLFLNGVVWKIDISTKAKINLDSGARIRTEVDIDPVVYMLGLGFKF